MYPDPRVAEFIGTHFVPMRVHVKQQADQFQALGQRFNAQWTPTTLIVNHSGAEQHRVEGFLPVDDFLAQLKLASPMRGSVEVCSPRPNSSSRPSWKSIRPPKPRQRRSTGRALRAFKALNDPTALRATAEEFRNRYTDTSWAKKASVWAR